MAPCGRTWSFCTRLRESTIPMTDPVSRDPRTSELRAQCSPTELALGEGIRAGDAAAFDAFIKQHWTGLVWYVTSFLGSVDESKDVVQEAFMRLWEQRRELRHGGAARAYVYQIARNVALNQRESRWVRDGLAAIVAEGISRPPTPAQVTEETELQGIVERAIALLPERRREAFVLAHFHKLSHREIADAMGISPQTVANQISAALADLRHTLASYI